MYSGLITLHKRMRKRKEIKKGKRKKEPDNRIRFFNVTETYNGRINKINISMAKTGLQLEKFFSIREKESITEFNAGVEDPEARPPRVSIKAAKTHRSTIPEKRKKFFLSLSMKAFKAIHAA